MSRQGRLSRHHDTEFTRPRVPIIPMLDMAFQLLAFGLTMFDLNPDKVEGQLSLSLPRAGAETQAPASPSTQIAEPDDEYTVEVYADGNGRVRIVKGIANASQYPEKEREKYKEVLPKEAENLTTLLTQMVEKKVATGGTPPKLDLQIDPELNYQIGVELIGMANTAKFKKVTPNLLNTRQGGEAAP